jgi:hypothetical protein
MIDLTQSGFPGLRFPSSRGERLCRIAAPFVLDGPIDRIAFETHVVKVLILAPDGVERSMSSGLTRGWDAGSRDENASNPNHGAPLLIPSEAELALIVLGA